MDVVDVDVVGLQAAQAVLDLLLDVQPRHARIVGPAAHRIEDLGGDDGVLPPALQRLAQHRLRHAADIGVGGIEEVDAGIEAPCPPCALASAWSAPLPKVMVPRQISETFRPLRPRRR